MPFSIAPSVRTVLADLGFGDVFPFTNGSTTDLVINGSNQTVAPTNGVLRYRSITFSTAHTLRITSSPCVLMIDTLTWNAAGVLACEASGTPALGADPAESFPRGGRAISTGDAIGGYGGGLLIVLANTVNGSTVGTIRASGTAGNRNTTNAAAFTGRGGEGALSAFHTTMAQQGYTMSGTDSPTAEQWLGGTITWSAASVGPGLPAMALAPGGEPSAGSFKGGIGGGSGGSISASSVGAGGSGFGGGGAAGTGVPPAVGPAVISPSLSQILTLLVNYGCRGGGGGGAIVHTTGTGNCAGGGGGGAVVLVVDTETQVSTLTAAGGAAVGTNAAAGGAGVTLRQVV